MVQLRDILLRSNQGKVYYTDPVYGGIKVLFNARKVEATLNIESNKYIELGKLLYGHYHGAGEITGSLEIYMGSSYFLKRMHEYLDGGESFAFDLHVENGVWKEDNSTIGTQHVILKSVLLNSLLITSLGQDTNASSGTYSFTADDYILTSEFNEINMKE